MMRALIVAGLMATVACGGASDAVDQGDPGSCHDVPSCPQDGAACYLEADDAGRLVDLWTCPAEATGNTPGCFLAHGCREESPCQSWPNPDGSAEPVTCWIQYGEVADTTGKVGLHPVDFWICPDEYQDQCK